MGKLKPSPEARAIIQQYRDGQFPEGEDKGVFGLIDELSKESFEPYCRERDRVCVAMESPVIAAQVSPDGGLYQNLLLTLAFGFYEIERCRHREFPDGTINGEMSVERFLLKHVDMNPESPE